MSGSHEVTNRAAIKQQAPQTAQFAAMHVWGTHVSAFHMVECLFNKISESST